MNQKTPPTYLKKSITLYKIYGALFLYAIIFNMLIKPLLGNYPTIADLLGGLPIFPIFVTAPIGLFYSWKSYKLKEGLPRKRFMFCLGHLFFTFLMLSFLVAIIKDMARL